jgi:hypothetical protein
MCGRSGWPRLAPFSGMDELVVPLRPDELEEPTWLAVP